VPTSDSRHDVTSDGSSGSWCRDQDQPCGLPRALLPRECEMEAVIQRPSTIRGPPLHGRDRDIDRDASFDHLLEAISDYAAPSYVSILIGLDVSGGQRALKPPASPFEPLRTRTYERPTEAAVLRMIGEADTAC